MREIVLLDYAPRAAPPEVSLWVLAGLGLCGAAAVGFWSIASQPPRTSTIPRGSLANMDIANLQDGLERFERDTGRFPTAAEGLEALVDQPDLLWRWKGPYFRRDRLPLIDPWGRAYVYAPPAPESRVLAVTSLGSDGKAGTADDIVMGP